MAFTRFRCNQVIRGWDEGVMKMSLGEEATLKITADYGSSWNLIIEAFLEIFV